MKKQYYGITLDPDIGEEAKKLAKDEDRSFSSYINRLLRKEIQRKGRGNRGNN